MDTGRPVMQRSGSQSAFSYHRETIRFPRGDPGWGLKEAGRVSVARLPPRPHTTLVPFRFHLPGSVTTFSLPFHAKPHLCLSSCLQVSRGSLAHLSHNPSLTYTSASHPTPHSTPSTLAQGPSQSLGASCLTRLPGPCEAHVELQRRNPS